MNLLDFDKVERSPGHQHAELVHQCHYRVRLEITAAAGSYVFFEKGALLLRVVFELVFLRLGHSLAESRVDNVLKVI